MKDYYRCTECSEIRASGELEYRHKKSLLTLVGCCPECGCEQLSQVSDICDECERHPALPDDDLCQNCADVEKDALADIELAAIEARERKRDEFAALVKDIVVSPWRRTG